MNSKTEIWLTTGYQLFTNEGPQRIKVEVLARLVNKSKSSFYHYFSDLEIYMDQLLDYHLERAKMIISLEEACNDIMELFEVFINHKDDLLFNRQLRLNRDDKRFETCFLRVHQLSDGAITRIWAAALGLPKDPKLATMILEMSVDHFYINITRERLNMTWLKGYLEERKKMVQAFLRTVQN